jgi:hypothetical protein
VRHRNAFKAECRTHWLSEASAPPVQPSGQGPQDRDELGRIQHLEVETLEPDVQGQLVQRVGPGVQHAGGRARRFQPARGGGGAPASGARNKMRAWYRYGAEAMDCET